MRITLSVELENSELPQSTEIEATLARYSNGTVNCLLVTDQNALTARIKEAMTANKYESLTTELVERLSCEEGSQESFNTLCTVALFSAERAEKGVPVDPFLEVLKRLTGIKRDKYKAELVTRIMTFLSCPRNVSCSRLPILPYAETLASLVWQDMLGVRQVILGIVQVIREPSTRCAGMTALGKLIECSYARVRALDTTTMEALRSAMMLAQQDDAFVYDVEYVMEALGWSHNKHTLAIRHSGAHHTHPILSLAFSGGGAGYREAVVTSSADGTIGTWDGVGALTENIVLSRHFASAVDLANRGHTLIVGMVGRAVGTRPAIVLYSEEGNSRESHWEESGAVEPKNARFITVLRSFRYGGGGQYCVGVSTKTSHSAVVYDQTQPIQYIEHADMVTAMHVPYDRSTTVITGSRDSSVMIYDLRSGQSVANMAHHYNTVSAISTCGDYIFTAGLDKRVVVEDMRMIGHQTITREMDSAVLSLSVSTSMQCAISTLTGLYMINFASGSASPPVSRADCGGRAPRYNAIAWNISGNVVYAGGDTTTLDLFSRNYSDAESFEVVQ